MSTQIRQHNGISIVEPSGKIVGHSVTELREMILPQIESTEVPRILINFKNVSMIDSSGLGTLMEAHAAATRKEGRVAAINVGRHIKNLIVLSRVVNMFEHFDDEDAAVMALSA